MPFLTRESGTQWETCQYSANVWRCFGFTPGLHLLCKSISVSICMVFLECHQTMKTPKQVKVFSKGREGEDDGVRNVHNYESVTC